MKNQTNRENQAVLCLISKHLKIETKINELNEKSELQ